MTKKALDEKYSYQIDEHNVVHLFRGEEDCQQHLTNPLLSAIFKIEELEAQIEKMKDCENCKYKYIQDSCDLGEGTRTDPCLSCRNSNMWEFDND